MPARRARTPAMPRTRHAPHPPEAGRAGPGAYPVPSVRTNRPYTRMRHPNASPTSAPPPAPHPQLTHTMRGINL